jgi:protein-serine/threonine kinase
MTALAAPAVYDLTFGEVDEPDWSWPAPANPRPAFARASTSYGYGVTVIGGGFEWEDPADKDEDEDDVVAAPAAPPPPPAVPVQRDSPGASSGSSSRTLTPSGELLAGLSRIRPPPLRTQTTSHILARRGTQPLPMIAAPRARHPGQTTMFTTSPLASPISSRPASPSPGLPRNGSSASLIRSPTGTRPTTPRPRRRSSQQRVSLIAGRLSLLPVSDPAPRPDAPQRLVRSGSARSFLSVAASVGPPTPGELRDEFLTGRSLSEFVVEREIGRGAYGLVKRAREMNEDGTMGVSARAPVPVCARVLSPRSRR